MRFLTEGGRIWDVCAAVLAASLVAFGCAHTDGQPYPSDTDAIEAPEEGGYAPNTLTATLSASRLHTLDLSFNDAMDGNTVETRVVDELGTPVPGVKAAWSVDKQTLHIMGPFAYCTTYGVTLMAGAANEGTRAWTEDVELSATVGTNPYDLDGSSECTADVAVSPLFTESLDGGIFLGETIAPDFEIWDITRADIAAEDLWYIDGTTAYTAASRIARIPSFTADGGAAIAKLYWHENLAPRTHEVLSTEYTFGFWDDYLPVTRAQSTTLSYEIAGSIVPLWEGPADAGDIDGDGAHEVILAEQLSGAPTELLQDIFILPGDIAHGNTATIDSAAILHQTVGADGEILEPFVAVGDLDADGKDDLAAIRHLAGSGGNTTDWQVHIAYGTSDMTMLFYGAGIEKIRGLGKRVIAHVAGGDVDGDGVSDLIIADMEKKKVGSTTVYNKPYVNIFLGGARQLGQGSITKFTSQVKWSNSYASSVNVRVLGDINGDGAEDLAILIEEKDTKGNLVSSNVYLMYGREAWARSYSLNGNITPTWGAKIVSDGYDDGIILEDETWDARTGDINNDGYDDFAIKAYVDGGYEVAWFLGGGTMNGIGKVITLEEAAATWFVQADD